METELMLFFFLWQMETELMLFTSVKWLKI